MQYFNVSLKSLAPLLPGYPFPLSHCISINLELKSAKQLCDFQKCLKAISMKMYFLWLCATMKLFFNEEIEVVSALLLAWVCCHQSCTPTTL